MRCSCGKETETRQGILGIGFIHGCWDKYHLETVTMTNDDGSVLDSFEDIVPSVGCERKTEKESIESYIMWINTFNEMQ